MAITVKFWDITLNNVEIASSVIKKRIVSNKLNVGFVNVIDLGKSSELLRLKCNLDSTSDYTNIIKVIKKISEEPYTTHHWIEFDPGNKVINPGFESGTWGGSETQSTEEVHSGTYSAKLVASGSNTYGGYSNYIYIGNQETLVKVYTYVKTLNTAKFYVLILFYDENLSSCSPSQSAIVMATEAETEWTEHSKTFEPGDGWCPADCRYIRLKFNWYNSDGNPDGTAYVDDFSLYTPYTATIGTYEDKSGWYALTNFQEGVKPGTTALNELNLELVKYGHNSKIWGTWGDWTKSANVTRTDETNNQKAYNNESAELSTTGDYIMVDGGTNLIERNGHYKAFCRIRSDVITDPDDYVTFQLIDNTGSQSVSDTFYTAGNTSNLNTKINKYWTMIFLDCPNLVASSDMDLKVTLSLGDTTDFFVDYFGMYCYRYTYGE